MKKQLILFTCMCCLSYAMAETGRIAYEDKEHVIEKAGIVDVAGPGEYTHIKTDGGSEGAVLHSNEKHKFHVQPGDIIIQKDLSVPDTGKQAKEPVKEPASARDEPARDREGPVRDRERPVRDYEVQGRHGSWIEP